MGFAGTASSHQGPPGPKKKTAAAAADSPVLHAPPPVQLSAQVGLCRCPLATVCLTVYTLWITLQDGVQIAPGQTCVCRRDCEKVLLALGQVHPVTDCGFAFLANNTVRVYKKDLSKGWGRGEGSADLLHSSSLSSAAEDRGTVMVLPNSRSRSNS